MLIVIRWVLLTKMAKTAVGGDDDRPKKFSDKIKKSAAAKDYKEKGAKEVVKKLGSMAADGVASTVSKINYSLGLTENPSPAHAANRGMRDRGGVTQRKDHFTSSFSSAREVSGTCATCAIEKIQDR